MTNLTDHAKFQKGVIVAAAERFGWDVADYGESINVSTGPGRYDLMVFVLHGATGLPEDHAGYAASEKLDGGTAVRTVGSGLHLLIAEETDNHTAANFGLDA